MMENLVGHLRLLLRSVPENFRSLYAARPNAARVIFLFCWIMCLLYAAIHTYRAASIVTDENLYTNSPKGVIIIEITSGGASDIAGIKVGDIITEVNGNPVHTAIQANEYIRQGYAGKKLDYTISRNGEISHRIVALAAYGLSFDIIIIILLALSCFILSPLVFLSRSRDPIARLFGWATLAFGSFLSISFGYTVSFYPDGFTVFRGTALPWVWGVAVALLYHLTLEFPVRRHTAPYSGRIYATIYGTALISVLILKLSPKLLSFYYILFMTLAVILVSEIVVRILYRGLHNPERAKRNRLMVVAGYVLLLFFLTLAISRYLPWARLLLPVSLFLPIAAFVTIARYRVFGLYFKVRKNLAYTLLFIGLIIVLIGVFFFTLTIVTSKHVDLPVIHMTAQSIELIWPSSMPTAEQAAFRERVALIVGGCLALVLFWLYRKGMKFLDARFYRGTVDYTKALHVFSTFATRFTDRAELAREAVLGICGLLHVKSAAIYFIENGSMKLRADCDCDPLALPRDIPCDEAMHNALLAKPSPQNLHGSPLETAFAKTPIEFIAPVLFRNDVVALLVLAQKQSETSYTSEDVELLEHLASQMNSALEVISLYDGVKEREHLRREFEIARKIQLSSLPTEIPEFPGLDIAVASIPAYEVGGDFYDLLVAHPNLTILIGDVSGKGTSAALHLSRIQGMIRVIHSFTTTLWELFVRLNSQAMEQMERNSFVTLSALRIDLCTRTATLVRAGHMPLVQYRHSTGDIVLHQPQGIGLGLDDRKLGQSLEEHHIEPEPGDVLLLMTDGVTEAENVEREQFGIDNLSSLIRQHANEGAESIKRHILEALETFGEGHPIHDDMTLVVVKVQ
jgi:serine phosphatase RsbU (regulator of sigma subunit)